MSTIVLATWQEIGLRRQTEPYQHVHDNTMQMEGAVSFLLQGNNPYAMSYRGTPMEQWWHENPALDHVIALPFAFLKSVPVYLLWNNLFHWYDDRLSQLMLLGVAIGSLFVLYKKPTFKLLAVTVFVFNPLFAKFVIEGRSDIVFLSFLLASLACLRRQHIQASLLLLTLAVTSKHTAWFIVPFFVTYLAAQEYFTRHAIRKLAPSLLLATIIVLPFALWDWHSFIDDIYSYPAGTILTSYPINGYSLSMALVTMKILPNPGVYFPAPLLQIFLVPLLGWLVYDLYHRPSMGRMMLYFGALLWPFWFLSRFLNDNYLGVLIAIFALGLLLLYDEESLKGKKPRDLMQRKVKARK